MRSPTRLSQSARSRSAIALHKRRAKANRFPCVTLRDKFPCACQFRLVVSLQRSEMSGTRIPRILFFAIFLAAIAQCVHDFPLLPDRMASHFGASGMPNGWMTKPQFFITYAVVLLPALIVEFWAHRRGAKTPDAKLRLPNKEYWLPPEPRADTLPHF